MSEKSFEQLVAEFRDTGREFIHASDGDRWLVSIAKSVPVDRAARYVSEHLVENDQNTAAADERDAGAA